MVEATITRAKTGNVETYEDEKLVKETTDEGVSVARIQIESTSSGGIRRSKPVTTQEELQVSRRTEAFQQDVNTQLEGTGQEARAVYNVEEQTISAQPVQKTATQTITEQQTTQAPYNFTYTGFTPLTPVQNVVTGVTTGGNYITPFPKTNPRGFGNVKATYSELGKGFANIFIPKPYEFETQKIITVDRPDTQETSFKKGLRTVVEFGANKPITSAVAVVSPLTLTRKGVALGVGGATVATGVGFVGGAAQKKVGEDFLKVEGSKEILSKAYASAESNVSPFNVAYDVSPTLVSKETQQKFTQTVYDELRSKGYSDKEAYRLTQQAYNVYRVGGTTAVTQQLVIGATAEGIGRAGYTSKGLTGIMAAGQFEGIGASIVSDVSTKKKVDLGKAVTYGSYGSATATVASGLIIKGSKIAEVGGNIADLSEAPSDVAYTLFSRGAKRITKRFQPKVLTLSPVSSVGVSSTVSDSVSKAPVGTEQFQGVKGFAVVDTQSRQYDTEFTKELKGVGSQTSQFSDTKAFSETDTKTEIKTDVKPVSEVPVTIDSKTFTDTKSGVSPFSQVASAAQTSTLVSSKVASSVFTPRKAVIPPFKIPGGVKGLTSKGKGKRRSQLKAYTPTFTAAAIGIKAKPRKASKRKLTGLEIRGI